MNDDELANLYLKTLVSIEEKGVLIQASDTFLLESATFHVITAWNPGAERPSHAENDAANERLHGLLVGKGLTPHRALGADPDSGHFEESWAVTGIDDQEAKAIGAGFGQVAVFRLSAGTQTVMACTDDWSLSRPL